MSNINANAAARMIEAGNAVLGPAPAIEIDSFNRLRLKYERPNVALIFERMDAARLAAPDGYSNAEAIVTELAAALQARGLASLDALLIEYDAFHGPPGAQPSPACEGCGASLGDPTHSLECPVARQLAKPKRRRVNGKSH
jgi:hypothetical protein